MVSAARMIKGGLQNNTEFWKGHERNVGDNGTPEWTLPTEPNSDLPEQVYMAPF